MAPFGRTLISDGDKRITGAMTGSMRISSSPFTEARIKAMMMRQSTTRFKSQRLTSQHAGSEDMQKMRSSHKIPDAPNVGNTLSAPNGGNALSRPVDRMQSERKKSHAIFVKTLENADPTFEKPFAENRYGEEFAQALFEEVENGAKENDTFGSRLRARLAFLIMSQRFEMFVGLVIITNFVVIAFETDARSRKDNSAPETPEYDFAVTSLNVISVVNVFYLMVYTIECAARLYVFRCEYFRHAWNNFDLACVVSGILAEILGAFASVSNVETPQGLRTLRTVRMLRASRVLVSFDELYALVSGLKNAMKTLMWAGGLMLMVLTMWSILAVEFVKPYMSEIALTPGFDSCTWCPTAFDTVLLANLTFFQIISGDGWSALGRPLIEGHPWTALLFVAVIFSMMFGLLNLIVAVIVDSAHQAREADIMNVAAKKDAARAAAWDCFSDMVDELDENGDGLISVAELRKGIMTSHDLAAYLTVMGIEEQDLEMVFELLDRDGDGFVTHEQFTHQLYQMKTQELPITMCYIRAGVSKLHLELERAQAELRSKLDDMVGAKIDVASRLEEVGAKIDTAANAGKRFGFFEKVAQEEHQQEEEELPKKGRRKSLFVGKPPPSLRHRNTMRSAKTREFKDLHDDQPVSNQKEDKGESGRESHDVSDFASKVAKRGGTNFFQLTDKDQQGEEGTRDNNDVNGFTKVAKLNRGNTRFCDEVETHGERDSVVSQCDDDNDFSAVVASNAPKRAGTDFALPGDCTPDDDELQCDEIE